MNHIRFIGLKNFPDRLLRRRLSRQREQRNLEGYGIRQLLQESDPGGAGGVFNNSSLFTQNQNVGDAEIQGVELEERWQVTPSFNIFGNLTALRGTNTTTNLPLPYISPLHGRSGVQYAPPGSGYSVMAIVDWAS